MREKNGQNYWNSNCNALKTAKGKKLKLGGEVSIGRERKIVGIIENSEKFWAPADLMKYQRALWTTTNW